MFSFSWRRSLGWRAAAVATQAAVSSSLQPAAVQRASAHHQRTRSTPQGCLVKNACAKAPLCVRQARQL
jgi:hypothetical protein